MFVRGQLRKLVPVIEFLYACAWECVVFGWCCVNRYFVNTCGSN